MLYVNDIKDTFLDFPDNENLSIIVFFEGCSHNCPGCHNRELQIQNKKHTIHWKDLSFQIQERCRRNQTNKVVLSGGDPFYQCDSRDEMLLLIDELEKSDIEVCAYTGYVVAYIEDMYRRATNSSLIRSPSYLKCGPFRVDLFNKDSGKTDEQFVLASSNQNFYRRIGYSNIYSCISENGVLKF